ncbi:hypothetical protein ACVGWR_07180, partial [Enterobacter hormaechei]
PPLFLQQKQQNPYKKTSVVGWFIFKLERCGGFLCLCWICYILCGSWSLMYLRIKRLFTKGSQSWQTFGRWWKKQKICYKYLQAG